MQGICKEYAKNMQEYAINMQKYAIVKYAEICRNMQKICNKYAINMQKYARPANIELLWEYARNMQKICKNMQYMQSGILYAEYARICTPHFADAAAAWTLGPGQAESSQTSNAAVLVTVTSQCRHRDLHHRRPPPWSHNPGPGRPPRPGQCSV